MYPFWDTVIHPLVMASDARRIVEIGALRGETTARMLEDLGPDAELHVIDPLPQFDPSEHEAHFGGRYVFHRALSLEVLGDLPAFDVALIDGDHNWYTSGRPLDGRPGRCPCASSTTSAGPTAAVISTTTPRTSRPSTASPTTTGG